MSKQQEVQSVCEGASSWVEISPVLKNKVGLERMSKELKERENLRRMKGDGARAGGVLLHQPLASDVLGSQRCLQFKNHADRQGQRHTPQR